MASKFKKTLKKVGKAAAIAAALYGGSKLMKNRKRASMAGMDDAGIGVSHFKDYISKKPKRTTSPINPTHMWDNPWGAKKGGRAKVTGIAKRGFGRALMKGKK